MSKRLFDVICSCVGLLLLSPVFLLIGLVLKVTSPGPIFFLQERIGLKGKPFNIIKFRTMTPTNQADGLKITIGADSRITTTGNFLRKSKLDELPQLVNVLKGEMSLVGPRPEVAEYINEYPRDVLDKILSVRPGITDRAAIELSDEASLLASMSDPKKAYVSEIMPIKANYYLEYVDNNSVTEDVKIIFSTLLKILR